MFRIHSCPYCGGSVIDQSDHTRRVEMKCPWCERKVVFDRDGCGHFGLWYVPKCLDCKSRRVVDADSWHCAEHGCKVVSE